VPQGDIILSRYWDGTTSTRASAIFHYYNSTGGNDLLVFGVAGDWGGAGQNWNTPNQISQAKMVIGSNGNVGIGTIAPQYKLSVNGTIGTKEVVVTNTGWADYSNRITGPCP